MAFKETLKFCFETSIINTFRFNFHYFSFKDALSFPVFIARHTCFDKLKGQVIIDCPIKKHIVKIGYRGLGTQDSIYDRTVLEIDGTVIFHGSAAIGRGTKLSIGGQLEIGNNLVITGASTIICKHYTQMGDNVLISWDCLFMDTDFHSIHDLKSKSRVNEDKAIIIGNKVWIGCRSTILKGAIIPNDSVIAASSLITRKLSSSNCVYGGHSGGEILKQDVFWAV